MSQAIKSVRVRQVDLPLNIPVVSRVGLFDKWPVILIDLEMTDGTVGQSYLEPYLKHSARYIVPAIQDLVERFKGEVLGPAEFFDRALKSLSLVGLGGNSMIAVSGLDMALWDAAAKRAGLPLAAYLGGSIGEVKAYNSNSLWLTNPASQGREAVGLIAQGGGFTGLKLRLGRDSVQEDLTAINSIRSEVGEDVKLMVDFNQGLRVDQALQRCRELDDLGLYWFEEPIAYDLTQGYAELRRRSKTPLQIGENFYGPRDAMYAINSGACDMIMPDMMRIGGVTGWMRTAAIADATGVPVSSHLYPEISAHLLRVTPTAHWLEWQDWADLILTDPFSIVNGNLQIPDKPGIGISWNEDAVSEFSYEI